MKTKLAFTLVLVLVLLGGRTWAQTDPTDPQVICVESVEPYQVDYLENGGAGTTGSTYTWNVLTAGFTGTITPGATSNIISIDWGTTPAGTYVLEVIETNTGCEGTPVQLSIVLEDKTEPTFDPIGPLCQNTAAPSLQTTSLEGITGSWSPSSIDTSVAGTVTYTFTPDPGQCAEETTMDITIDPEVTPTFTPIADMCQYETAPALATTSLEGVTGVWSPSAIDTNTPGTVTYTFTPDPGQCAIEVTMDITINPEITPTFSPIGPFCQNLPAPALPGTSLEGVTGTWSPSTIDTSVAGTVTYTFTPDPGQCAVVVTVDITIDDEILPNFTPIDPLCQDSPAPTLSGTALNGITGTWSPATVDTSVPGTVTYTFTPDPGQCAIETTMDITINPLPVVDAGLDETICEGESVDLTATGADTYEWSPGTGLSSTTGDTVTANPTSTTTYTVTGTDANGCQDTDDITVTVNPLPTTSPIYHN
ncbi:MAG: hypothetical protein R2809_02930 [Flavobacteriales bacterium]